MHIIDYKVIHNEAFKTKLGSSTYFKMFLVFYTEGLS